MPIISSLIVVIKELPGVWQSSVTVSGHFVAVLCLTALNAAHEAFLSLT